MFRKLKKFAERSVVISTCDLNQAGFYQVFGSELTSVSGKYPNNLFTFKVSPLVLWYEKIGGFVPYNKFCKERQKLKIKSRKFSGLPASFTGKKEYGFKLLDMATFSHWK